MRRYASVPLYCLFLIAFCYGCGGTPLVTPDSTRETVEHEQPPARLCAPDWEEWVHLPVRFLFVPNSAELSYEAREMLVEVHPFLSRREDIVRLRIEGHAGRGDSDPLEISMRRAQAIAEGLASLGISRDSLEIEAYGTSRTLCCSTCSCDLVQDLRVEFSMLVLRPGECPDPEASQ